MKVAMHNTFAQIVVLALMAGAVAEAALFWIMAHPTIVR